MSGQAAQRFLLGLLFDADLRERFFADRDATLTEEGLAGSDADAFRAIDREGVELDASLRRDYLLSALCRGYPLSAGAIGAQPGGARQIEAFLASPKLITDTATRAQLFGDHLARLVSHNVWKLPPAVHGLLQAIVTFEHGLATRAAELRAALERGAPVARPRTPPAEVLATGKLRLPPFFLAAELPVPTSLVRGALDQIGPEDAWHRIAAGRLQAGRVATIARGDAIPVTIVARAVPRGGSDRGAAGGVAAIVEVTHLSAELAGRRTGLLSRLDGTRGIEELPVEDRAIARQLAEGGLVEVAG